MKAQPESQEGPILLRVAQIKRWLWLAMTGSMPLCAGGES